MITSDRRDKILDVAIALAEEGGYDNVRQRDVAAAAGVALGTLYKRFRSKEDILVAALDREAEILERKLERKPSSGDTQVQRIDNYFGIITKFFCKRPKFARAVLRSMASGEPEVAQKITAYQGRMTGLLIAAMRGTGTLTFEDAATSPPTEDEVRFAFLLQSLWFASLVGWSAGLVDQAGVVEHVRYAAEVFLRGMAAMKD